MASLATAEDLPERLKFVLETDRRSARLPTSFSPELSYGRHTGPAPHTARAAAVMVVLFRRDGRWHIPLTERPLSLAHHAGQISLPGGAIEPGETAFDAGLRELQEELGFDGPHIRLGQLADCYVFASDFLVTPWLIAAPAENVEWQPDDREVQQVVELPLERLFEDDALGSLWIERGPLTFHAPCIRVGDARVWGATSIILQEVASLARLALEDYA